MKKPTSPAKKTATKRKEVTMGVKGTKFRIIDHETDEVIHKSKSYSSNSNASRGGKRYCKRMGYVVKEMI